MVHLISEADLVGLLAHGVGARGDLPLPATALAIGAAIAVVVSAVAMMVAWTDSAFEELAIGRQGPRVDASPMKLALVFTRLVGVVLFATTLIAALTVTDNSAENISVRMVYVFYWVVLPLSAVVLGDLWRLFSPFEAVASVLEFFGSSTQQDDGVEDQSGALWGVAVALLAFLWFELAYHKPASAVMISWYLATYAAWMVIGTVIGGRRWLRANDPLGILVGLFAAIAPVHVYEGRLRFRWPLTGLARVVPRRGLAAVVLVVLAGTSFDGVSRTGMWEDLMGDSRGWSATGLRTVGLVFTIAVATALYLLAIRFMRTITSSTRDDLEDVLALSLVPVAVGYAIAHYFSLAVFEGQFLIIQASDPLSKGWDLFGTGGWFANYTVVSTTTIAWAQAGGIIVGHLSGVVIGHDRAVKVLPKKHSVDAQLGLVLVMATFTVIGLLIMVNA
jgi:hypothetical protein